ncbi:hypothetical protein ASPFODRAFT_66337 [Aspergillus luchuensis CBS 106.47]|uniref:Uncharacterized protein n=1 Tax=Aspergillus luchuensis (strain CBS 106.47) TaxID=1137211 RepID=A0A1M3TYJ0_ASPLC|nr:hypothetical protein ASPFODRAFT_66337 [Aspergillus luchuensis CBS 106.47]
MMLLRELLAGLGTRVVATGLDFSGTGVGSTHAWNLWVELAYERGEMCGFLVIIQRAWLSFNRYYYSSKANVEGSLFTLICKSSEKESTETQTQDLFTDGGPKIRTDGPPSIWSSPIEFRSVMLWDVQIPNSEVSVDICISALHCIALHWIMLCSAHLTDLAETIP